MFSVDEVRANGWIPVSVVEAETLPTVAVNVSGAVLKIVVGPKTAP